MNPQIEDLKSYFDEEDAVEDSSADTTPESDSPEMLMMNTFSPRSREDLLTLLPPRNIADRLVMRYFSSNSASQRTSEPLTAQLSDQVLTIQ